MTPAAVVTGGASGLGFEIARGLATRGYAVTIADVDESAARGSPAELGAGVEAAVLDVREAADCRRLAHDVAEGAGALDVWVNNAGILRCAPSWEHSDEASPSVFVARRHRLIT